MSIFVFFFQSSDADKVLIETAAHFGGMFVGYLDQMSAPSSISTLVPPPQPLPLAMSMRAASRKIRWRCAEGHEFDEYIGIITSHHTTVYHPSFFFHCDSHSTLPLLVTDS